MEDIRHLPVTSFITESENQNSISSILYVPDGTKLVLDSVSDGVVSVPASSN